MKNFLTFWNVFKENSLNSRFRKHYLGVMEPPQIKNERYILRVFPLFLRAKPNSRFLDEKTLSSENALQGNLDFEVFCTSLVKRVCRQVEMAGPFSCFFVKILSF